MVASVSARVSGNASEAAVIAELKSELYGGDNPLSYASRRFVDTGYPHTNLLPDVVGSVIDTFQPKFWLELGSMLGGSAIRVADIVKSRGASTEIVCIDPFTGDVNMWAWEQPFRKANEWLFLRLENGRPTIYDRFLANVSAAGHADIILPIAATSIVGIKLLRRLASESRLSCLPDVIYLDSAHEPDETFLELQNCWELLKPGGVLIGDDWDWSAVQERCNQVRGNSQDESRWAVADWGSGIACSPSRNGILLDRGQWVLVK